MLALLTFILKLSPAITGPGQQCVVVVQKSGAETSSEELQVQWLTSTLAAGSYYPKEPGLNTTSNRIPLRARSNIDRECSKRHIDKPRCSRINVVLV